MAESYMVYVWLALTVVLALIEAATAQLTTIWFAAGAFVTMLLALFGVKSIPVQIVVFACVSLIALIATRPLVKKVLNKKKQPTNADMNIGETGIVTEKIDNVNASGAVKLKGVSWTARSEDGAVIAENELVKVIRIEGVKLIVKKIN